MFVTDTAAATILSAFSNKTNQKIFNVGNGKEPINLISLAKKIGKISKKKIKIKFSKNFKNTDRNKQREIFERYCDSSKLQKLIFKNLQLQY